MSEQLLCSVESCTYNRRRHCGASDIKIEGQRITRYNHDTYCGSYVLAGSPKAAAWLAGPAEFKSGITQLTDRENMKPMVYCAVKNCRYYRDGNCEAVTVEIENQPQNENYAAMCQTFQVQN